ncbi:MAG: hypothetical protein WKG01_28550 [Kofleriaceae bacterium]
MKTMTTVADTMSPADDARIAELRQLGEELQQTFATERKAIAALDHAQLAELAVIKVALANRLHALRDLATRDHACRMLFEAIRVEAKATAMLAQVANEAVRAMLGYDQATGYDRLARRAVHGPSRTLVAL